MTKDQRPMELDQGFWDFSLWLYGIPEVAECCLKLQDRHHIDVNLLLFCYWHGVIRGNFGEEIFARAHTFSHSWSSNVVQSLRKTRIWMKGYNSNIADAYKSDSIELRNRIKALELNAEQHQQTILESFSHIKPAMFSQKERRKAIKSNLKLYTKTIPGFPNSQCDKLFTCIESYALKFRKKKTDA